MEKLYIAQALVFDEGFKGEGREMFCGLYKQRRNAYRGIRTIMEMSDNKIPYIPQVRVAEVLDDVDSDFSYAENHIE